MHHYNIDGRVPAGDVITDLSLVAMPLIREIGTLSCDDYMEGGFRPQYRAGGETLCRIATMGGRVGYGPGAPPEVLDAARAVLVGADPASIATLAPRIRAPQQRGGGVEIALWDLAGRLAGLPLYALWGAASAKLQPYASLMTRGAPAERAERCRQLQAEGWRGVKLRTSFETLAEDVAVVAAVRAAVGDDFMILADGNKAGPYGKAQPRFLWDMARARETARRFADLGVRWLEEPLGRYDHAGYAALRADSPLWIAGGENHRTLEEYSQLIGSGGVDVINPEVMVVGPSLFLEVAALAATAGVHCVGHMGHGGLGTLCALHLNAAASGLAWAEIVHEPPIADFRTTWTSYAGAPNLGDDGLIVLSDRPGLGVAVAGAQAPSAAQT